MTAPDVIRARALDRGWIPDPLDDTLFVAVDADGTVYAVVLRELTWYTVPATRGVDR